jgi:hypothetical protein
MSIMFSAPRHVSTSRRSLRPVVTLRLNLALLLLP